ncbi:MAG: hypothetical protein CFE36_09645 [Sphingomonadaceae bacterium PASS1]|nr:MAG: hypothetical protein CFE36_09645 [Sphingomonadaceae bacterium PASS1]
MAVVLNWNNFTDTIRCIDSILCQEEKKLGICIVDNGSSDGSPKKLLNALVELCGSQRTYPSKHPSNFDGYTSNGIRIRLVCLQKNLGFGAGVNYGINNCSDWDYQYYLLLNNDATLHNKMIKELIKAHKFNDMIGIVGSKNVDIIDGSFIEGGIIYNSFMRRKKNNNNSSLPSEVDKVIGSSMMISKDVFNSVGGFSEQYFLYFEDDDICLKVKKNKLKILYVPASILYHSRSGSSNQDLRNYYICRNECLLILKFSQKVFVIINLAIWFFGSLRTLAGLIFKHNRPRAARVQWWAMIDALSGRYGEQRSKALLFRAQITNLELVD